MVAEKKETEGVVSGKVHLVIRIRRRKTEQSQCTSTCLGTVSTIFSFKTMCDFQYLPICKAETASCSAFEDLVPHLVPSDFTSALSWWDRSESESKTSQFLPPFLFSRYNTPSSRILCNEGDRQDGNRATGGPGRNLRVERKALTLTVQARDPFPIAPAEVAVKDAELRCKNPHPHRLLQELFEERPLWTRVGITYRTKLDENLLKVLLAKYAFYILSGPWGRLWCKFGYDPRTEPSAMKYQTVMVTFRQHQNIPERQRLKVSMSERATVATQHTKVSQLISYVYKPGHLPPVRQMWYCVCDIELPAAQKVLEDDFFGVLKQCDDISGWLPPDVISSIRNAIKDDVRRISQQLEEDEREEMEGDEMDSQSADSDEW
jgi:general transcription factor 3C polypeptide 5 (transcription factor C subunit 1)